MDKFINKNCLCQHFFFPSQCNLCAMTKNNNGNCLGSLAGTDAHLFVNNLPAFLPHMSHSYTHTHTHSVTSFRIFMFSNNANIFNCFILWKKSFSKLKVVLYPLLVNKLFTFGHSLVAKMFSNTYSVFIVKIVNMADWTIKPFIQSTKRPCICTLLFKMCVFV